MCNLKNAKRKIYTGKNPGVVSMIEGICPICGKVKAIYLDANGNNAYTVDKDGNKLFPSLCDCDYAEESEIIKNEVSKKLGISVSYTMLDRSGLSEKELSIIKTPFKQDQYNLVAYEVLCKWIADFKIRKSESFVLHGPTGRGKTFLCLKTAISLLNRGVDVYFTTFKDFIEDLYASNDYDKVKAAKQNALKCSVLILDDLGAENTTDFAKGELYSLLDKRSMYKSVIVTTNLLPHEIKARYGERVYTRLMNGVPANNVLEMNGAKWPR